LLLFISLFTFRVLSDITFRFIFNFYY